MDNLVQTSSNESASGTDAFEETPDRVELNHSDLANDFWFLIVKIRSQMRTAMNADSELATFDLNARTYAALALACTNSGPSQRDLAEFLTLDARQLVYVIDKLEELGLIERRSHPKDRRLNVIYSTQEGERTYQLARAKMMELEEAALRSLPSETRDMMVGILKEIAFN